MKTIDETPTSPADYATLTAAYAVAFAGVAAAAHRRRLADDPLPLSELVWSGAAAFAASQTVVHQKIEAWLRRPFVQEAEAAPRAPDRKPRGRGLRYAVGELLSCTRCTGAWAALALTGLSVASPRAGRVATRVLAVTAANDFLEAGFQVVCKTANRSTP